MITDGRAAPWASATVAQRAGAVGRLGQERCCVMLCTSGRGLLDVVQQLQQVGGYAAAVAAVLDERGQLGGEDRAEMAQKHIAARGGVLADQGVKLMQGAGGGGGVCGKLADEKFEVTVGLRAVGEQVLGVERGGSTAGEGGSRGLCAAQTDEICKRLQVLVLQGAVFVHADDVAAGAGAGGGGAAQRPAQDVAKAAQHFDPRCSDELVACVAQHALQESAAVALHASGDVRHGTAHEQHERAHVQAHGVCVAAADDVQQLEQLLAHVLVGVAHQRDAR